MASESTTNLSINSEAVILQMFFKISVWCSGDFGTIFKGNFFYRTLTVAASVNGVCQYLSFLNILFNRFCPMEKSVVTPHIAYINFFFDWDSLHARLNSHYKAWSYKKGSTKKITG